MLPAESCAVIVRLSVAPATGVTETALRLSCVATPTVTFDVAGELLDVHERQSAVTT